MRPAGRRNSGPDGARSRRPLRAGARRQPARIRTDQGLDRHRLREDAVWDVPVVPAATAPGTRRRPSSALRSTALPLT
ncbi:hypothetical protein [Pseudonocardia yunnanensis]|uniref:Uncharacterized protein n=1 Tax=Pseudonocardia yunnanensis TaxID=58107 RepID=A0ABW4EM85_9PSEU